MNAKPSFLVHSSFEAIDPQLRSIWSRHEAQGFDHTLPWFEILAPNLLDGGGQLCLISVIAGDGTPLAALPLHRPAARELTLQPQLTAFSNFYSALYAPIVFSEPADPSIFDALAAGIRSVPDWGVLDLNPVSLDDPNTIMLRAALERTGMDAQTYFRFGNWYYDVTETDADQYFAGRPGQLRSTLKRKRRKLERERAMEIQIFEQHANLEHALDNFAAVYEVSWKQSEPYPQFIRAIASTAAERGWLRLGQLLVDGRPAASQIWFVCAGDAAIFKLAQSPEFDDYSVGSILTAELMRHVIDKDKVQHIDYLIGDDGYKKNWTPVRRERVGLRLYRRDRLTGRLAALAGALTQRAKRLAGRS